MGWLVGCELNVYLLFVVYEFNWLGSCLQFIYLIRFYIQFLEKAPEEIVRTAQEKAEEMEEKINLTRNRIAFLESTALVTEPVQ